MLMKAKPPAAVYWYYFHILWAIGSSAKSLKFIGIGTPGGSVEAQELHCKSSFFVMWKLFNVLHTLSLCGYLVAMAGVQLIQSWFVDVIEH